MVAHSFKLKAAQRINRRIAASNASNKEINDAAHLINVEHAAQNAKTAEFNVQFRAVTNQIHDVIVLIQSQNKWFDKKNQRDLQLIRTQRMKLQRQVEQLGGQQIADAMQMVEGERMLAQWEAREAKQQLADAMQMVEGERMLAQWDATEVKVQNRCQTQALEDDLALLQKRLDQKNEALWWNQYP